MIEVLAQYLNWGLQFDLPGVVIPEENWALDATQWPKFAEVVIFVETVRGRRDAEGAKLVDEYRIWAIAIPEDGGLQPHVVASLLLPEQSRWPSRVYELMGRFGAKSIVPLDDSVALALWLAKVPKVELLHQFLFLHLSPTFTE